MFLDRADAGRQLAAAVEARNYRDPVVLALPRGGVIVGAEIARALRCPLDVLLVRKLGAPGNPELAIGAVALADEPIIILDDHSRVKDAPPEYIEREVRAQLDEIRRRSEGYAEARSPVPLEGRTAIVVDDGVATGSTARAALRAVRHLRPALVVLAAPVMAPEPAHTLQRDADEVLALATPRSFRAVGEHYIDFRQTTDDEVVAALRSARDGSTSGAVEPSP